MNKITKIKMGVSLPVLAFSFLAAFNVAALSLNDSTNNIITDSPTTIVDGQKEFGGSVYMGNTTTCAEQAPTCAELGYTQTLEYCQSVSAAGNILKCPFDLEKVFCIANGDENCQIGSILYEDKKCHTSSNLTPIGVVFDTSKKLAIALTSSELQYSTEYYIFNNGFHDPDHECDGPNFGGIEQVSGKEITYAYIPVAKCLGVSLPAMEYCASYSTPGTSAGDWFLGSKTELAALINNKAAVNATLAKLGLSDIGKKNDYIWTATEGDNTVEPKELAWIQIVSNDSDDQEDKVNANTVIPVISY